MAKEMNTQKLSLFILAAVSVGIVQATSCNANDKLQVNGSVGAASVHASGVSLRVNLERQFDDSRSLKPAKPVQKSVPEPVCHTHSDLDKTLILGGSDTVPM